MKSARSKEEIKPNNKEMKGVNNSNTSGIQGHKMQKNTSIKTRIHNQEES